MKTLIEALKQAEQTPDVKTAFNNLMAAVECYIDDPPIGLMELSKKTGLNFEMLKKRAVARGIGWKPSPNTLLIDRSEIAELLVPGKRGRRFKKEPN